MIDTLLLNDNGGLILPPWNRNQDRRMEELAFIMYAWELLQQERFATEADWRWMSAGRSC